MIKPAFLVAASMLVAENAHALSCQEIMNMVNVNVPTPIVVQTIQDSGDQFTTADIRCLINEGAPDEITAAARKLLAGVSQSNERIERAESEIVRDRQSDPEPEELGRRRSKSAPEEDDSGSPEKMQDAIKLYRAKKPLTASLILFDLLEDERFPEREGQIMYYLARCLYDLEMYHTSQYYFLKVLRKGPSNPYFKHALPKLVTIARYTEDNSELQRVVEQLFSKVGADAFPRSSRNHLYYLMGVRLYEKDQLARARKYFAQISSKSDLYLRAKYYEGVIYNEQGRLKSAVRSFRDIVRSEVQVSNSRELQRVKDIQNYALLNIARIYYGIQRFDEAAKYYELVERDSKYWPESLFEAAYANFLRNDINSALGQVLTVNSPAFMDDEYIPEAKILKALTFFNLCEYNEVERILIKFDQKHRPMYNELKSFVQEYASTEGKKMADQAYERYFEDGGKGSHLDKAFFNTALHNRDLAALVNRLEMLDREVGIINEQKTRWRDSIGNHLKKVLENDRQNYKRRAGLVMLREMARQTAYLGDLLTQSEIIRFEVVDAQRLDYQYKMANPDLDDQLVGQAIDFATSVDYIYWPFNGEFWADELGYYHYAEQGNCK
jgi:tetratricopeptide (TPR) repeat protein